MAADGKRLFRFFAIVALMGSATVTEMRGTVKPVLHGRHWVAITGKPLAATAGAKIFEKGGNAVDAPEMQMAEGYPIEQELADSIERQKARIKEWPYSRKLFLTHPGEPREAPRPGEIFRQPDLLDTLKKLVEAERQALASGKSRR